MSSHEMDPSVHLQQRWQRLTGGSTVDQSVQDKWWNNIVYRYSEPHRKYHTLFHLRQMFLHMESVADEIQNKDAVSYAIFFHDIHYDTHAQDNEEQSLDLFYEFAKEAGIDQDEALVAKVKDLILSSKSHCTEEHKTEGSFGTEDVHYFLDFDLSILGSDPEEYQTYNVQIREEYNSLPKMKYDFLRKKVLELFLQIPNIYATQKFREKYEGQARKNIEAEIECLLQGE